MRRREFIAFAAGTVAGSPLVARAQPGRTRRIAWLGLGRPDDASPYLDSLRSGLREWGWIEGENLVIRAFWATGREDMEGVARDLLATEPEVIVTQEFMVFPVKALTSTIPIVIGFSGDPVPVKLIDSYSRPGGNITGISYLALVLVGKRIELLKELVPDARRLAILARPQHPGEPLEREASEEVVRKLGMELAYSPTSRRRSCPLVTWALWRRPSSPSVRSVATRWWCFPIPPCSRSATALRSSPSTRDCRPSPVGRRSRRTDC
jgi:putative tryptophan/tyrosine transport system substrate-binding protein